MSEDIIYQSEPNHLDVNEAQVDDKKKALLLETFSDLIDRVSSNEIENNSDKSVDLYSIFKELAELKNEVKKESRQVKSAFTEFKSIFDLLSDDNAFLKTELANKELIAAKKEKSSRKDLALSLIEYRDYLVLSLKSMSKLNKRTWLDRILNRKNSMLSFIEGQQMLLSRFDNLLLEIKVVPMVVLDEDFDPALMKAVDTFCDENKSNSIVLEEQRTGYFLNNEILRLAQVVVNKWRVK